MLNLSQKVTPGASAAVENYFATARNLENREDVPIGSPCVNKSCETTFNGPETKKSTCTYHPGAAIFHEGMKYWSCCKRKTTDFSSFLDQAGCTTGEHQWTKNEQLNKIREEWFSRQGVIQLSIYCKGVVWEKCVFQADTSTLHTKIVYAFGNMVTEKTYDLYGRIIPEESNVIISERKIEIMLKQVQPSTWPKLVVTPGETQEEATSVNEMENAVEKQEILEVNQSQKMLNLSQKVTPGASAAVEKYYATTKSKENGADVPIGSPCVNKSCETTFNGPDTNKSTCKYHPGDAIFHEGMKYWSCCKRKTTDFSTFLDQAGCTAGEHQWTKNEQINKIREEWFSRQGVIQLNVYCKGAVWDKCLFQSNSSTLHIKIVYAFGNMVTEKTYNLYGRIIPDESNVIIGERKIEIMLKQMQPMTWPNLVATPGETQEEAAIISEMENAAVES